MRFMWYKKELVYNRETKQEERGGGGGEIAEEREEEEKKKKNLCISLKSRKRHFR